MKRKIAILLSAVMVASAMPLSVMASSSNSISDTVTVSSSSTVTNDVSLIIKPSSTYTEGSTFYLELSGASFRESAVNATNDTENGTALKFGNDNETFDEILEKYGTLEKWGQETGNTSEGSGQQARIPYKLTYVSSSSVAVELLPFDGDTIESDYLTTFFKTTPYVEIKLANLIKSSSSGTMTVTVEGNGTGITSGTYTIGTIYSGSGSTTTTIADTTTFNDEAELETITIKENVAGTFADGETNFKKGDKITLKLNSGFVFSNSASDITLSGSRNLTGTLGFSDSTVTVDDRVITITLGENDAAKLEITKNLTSALTISGLKVEPEDEDKNYGDVKLTISGSSNTGITQETITVGTRQAEGLNMELVDEATTIISGRTYAANSDLDEDDFVTAEVEFYESYAGAWGDSRLDFTVPEGVQITSVEFTDSSYIDLPSSIDATDTGYINTVDSDVFITNNGRTLRFAKGFNKNITEGNAADFTMVLKLSVVPGYEGEVTLSASGAGSSEGDISDVVIANVISPISVETSTTNLNLGYTSYKTADISIIENVPGALIEGEELIIALDSTFSSEIAITDATVKTSSDELTISKTTISSGSIVIKIGSASSDEAATITVSDIQIGTTRSIPYGSYDLEIYGGAVINNYDEDNNATSSSKANQNFAYQGDVSYYVVDDYINVVTSTGTLDNVVKVTIGESTVLVNDEAYDVDVAPYIQASSNSTLVPLRFVTVALGLDDVDSADESSKISFDANTKTATIYYGSGSSSKVIQFQAGSNIMNIAGTQIAMENGVTAEIKDGRMFVPFRALGQALGVSVSWDEDTRTAIYNAK